MSTQRPLVYRGCYTAYKYKAKKKLTRHTLEKYQLLAPKTKKIIDWLEEWHGACEYTIAQMLEMRHTGGKTAPRALFQGQLLILPQNSKKVASAQSQRTPSQRTGAKKAPPALFLGISLISPESCTKIHPK